MTDERVGDRLWLALDHLADGATGVVLRHYSLSLEQRTQIGLRIAKICRSRGIALAVGKDEDLATRLGAQLVHNPHRAARALPFSRSVHSMQEAVAAREAGAALVFISPVYPTRSHPRRASLGIAKSIDLAKAAGTPAIALGGMTKDKFKLLEAGGFYGWAGIDAWDRSSD